MAKRWNDLTPAEKRQWFENSYRMHQNMDAVKRDHIYEKIAAARKSAAKHRKPKWYQRKK